MGLKIVVRSSLASLQISSRYLDVLLGTKLEILNFFFFLPLKIFCEPQDLKTIEGLIVSWKTGLTTTTQAVESTSYVAVNLTQVEDDVKEKVEKLKHDLQAYDDSLKVWTTLDTL